MTDVNEELIQLLKDFIKEQKEENQKTNQCLLDLKNRMTKIEESFKNCSENRKHCYKTQEDAEGRLRDIEKSLPNLINLPAKFDGLAIKVYTSVGALTVIIVIAGVWIKTL